MEDFYGRGLVNVELPYRQAEIARLNREIDMAALRIMPPTVFIGSPRALTWYTEHVAHRAGFKVTAKTTRCLGCGKSIREQII